MRALMAYLELTKPRALVVIIFTTCLGYLIAEPESVDWWELLTLALGTAVAAAGSLALNQYLERRNDARMVRTRSRPIPSGRISPRAANLFGWVLMLGGYVLLWFGVNPACGLATVACGLSYLYLYTPLKYSTSLSSFAGAIPGALLPVMGWLGNRGEMELGAWLLFVILFLWQIPHALIIAIRYREDYARAGMRQLPVIASNLTATRQIILNVIILIPVTLLPPFFNITRGAYAIAASGLGAWLLYRAVIFAVTSDERQARKFFVALSTYLPLLLIAMYLDKWTP